MAETVEQTPVDPSQPQQKPGFGPAVAQQARNEGVAAGGAGAAAPSSAPVAAGAGSGALGGVPQEQAQTEAHRRIGERVFDFIKGGQSTGSFWRGILSGALTGMAAGAAKGHFGQGMAAGQEAAQKLQQQKFEQQQQKTKEETEAQLRRAQTANILQQTADAAWNLSRGKVKATQEDFTFAQNFHTSIMDRPGAIDLGNTRDLAQYPEDLIALHKAYPNLPKQIAQGSIIGVPTVSPMVDANGKATGDYVFAGFHSYFVPPDQLKQLIDRDIAIPKFVPGKDKDDFGHYEDYVLKAGRYTWERAFQLEMDARKEASTHNLAAAVAKAETAEERLQLERDKMLSPEQIQHYGEILAQDPMNFNLLDMANIRSGDRLKIYDEAHSRNPDFNPEQVKKAWENLGDFVKAGSVPALSRANQIKAIRHLNSLGEAAAALNNNDTALANRIAAEWGRQNGHPEIASYDAMLNVVAGESIRGFTGAAVTEKEGENFRRSMHEGQSPAQQHDALQHILLLYAEQLADQYRQFNDAVFGMTTPEKRHITIAPDDVQSILDKYNVTRISPNGPMNIVGKANPVADRIRIRERLRAGGQPVPEWIPDDAQDATYDYKQGKYTGFYDRAGKWHGPPADATKGPVTNAPAR